MPNPPLSQTQARRLRTLRNRRNREESGLFLVEGIRVVEELAASPVVIETVVFAPSLEDTQRGRQLHHQLSARVPVLATTEAGLRQLAETETPQGIMAVARIPRHALPSILPQGALLAVLDGVQDPGNVGTLVRSADAFGVAAVIALPGTVDFWNGKTVRAAAGACFRVPLVHCTLPELAVGGGSGVTLWGAA
jgi:TrmH family RNA methyltransferase